MRVINRNSLENYLISLLVHMLVLFFLGFVSYKQAPRINELIIDWVTQETPEVVQEDFVPAGITGLSSSRTAQAQISQAVEESPVVERLTPERTVARSIEPPTLRVTDESYTAPASGTGATYLSGVLSNLSSGQSRSSGFLLEDDDGNISILKSVNPNPPISDYGRVKLQFKIKQDGTVDAQSIVPVIIDNPIYTQESIKALRQWRFSVKSYNRDKAYRITFIFKPE